MSDQSARGAHDLLIELLSQRRLLLVLDNCEHLLDAVCELVGMLLRACPNMVILATSREPLRIAGEHVTAVPPLGIPRSANTVGGAGAYTQCDSTTLFNERASSAHSGLELDGNAQEVVASICRKLDGLPLPIELAAAMLQSMSVRQILERLTDRYKLLVRSGRDALAATNTSPLRRLELRTLH
ncbi:putative ATPase [Rhodococcus sp. 27YEA15]|uniref:ATP-binding protein n=1 Tax=Rhodococcus sp. 27YEA15 TaxID=3156259 RepID=UPI003C79E3C2